MRIVSVPLAALLLLVTGHVAAAQTAAAQTAAAPTAAAPTADEVIDRSLKAVGGREAHAKLKVPRHDERTGQGCSHPG